MNLIIFGAPGAGKGTQAKILSNKFGIAHISTGDILREAIANETEVGKKAKAIVNSGQLVPDDVMCEIIKDVLKSDRCKNGFILDGFPRTIKQAELLLNIFEELNISGTKLIKLTINDETVIKRLTSRRTCSNCGYIVNLLALDNQDKCPNCNQENTLEKRKDDNEDVIKNRLAIYRESTAPVFDFLKNKIEIIAVDGSREVEEVTSDILNFLQD